MEVRGESDMDKTIIKQRLEELEKKRYKYHDAYQQDGSPSSLRTYEKYDDLCEICYTALKQVEEIDNERNRRIRNFNQFIVKYKEESSLGGMDSEIMEEVLTVLNRVKMFL